MSDDERTETFTEEERADGMAFIGHMLTRESPLLARIPSKAELVRSWPRLVRRGR